jgi:hypothetical protein
MYSHLPEIYKAGDEIYSKETTRIHKSENISSKQTIQLHKTED